MHEVVFVRLVNRPLDTAPVEAGHEVNQRLNRSGDRNPVVGRVIFRPERGPAIDSKPRSAALGTVGYRDLDQLPLLAADPPKRRCTRMTEHGHVTTGDDSSHPASVAADRGSPNRINPLMKPMQSPGGDSMIDRPFGEPKCQQLPARNHPMLPLHELPNRPISPTRKIQRWLIFRPHRVGRSALAEFPP